MRIERSAETSAAKASDGDVMLLRSAYHDGKWRYRLVSALRLALASGICCNLSASTPFLPPAN